MENAAQENWRTLLSLFPPQWRERARESGAVGRLRGFSSAEALLRTLLLHIANGFSLRETAVQAKLAHLANGSDVALLKRLRNSEEWLRRLCVDLLRENGIALALPASGKRLRIVDGTLVKEPGKTGSQWRILYSLQLPALHCDFFEITATAGKGTGESFRRLPIEPEELVLGDAGYWSTEGMAFVRQHGADVLVRVNPQNFAAYGPQEQAHRRLRRKASKQQTVPKPETLEYAQYVIVFTTLAAESVSQVWECYRLRWQIELAFKRMKALAHLGHLPKHDDRSARAWLYGKLLVALLTQKLIRVGRDISPWGYSLQAASPVEPLA